MKDRIQEILIVVITAVAMSANNSPGKPVIKKSGIKTTTVVIADPVFDNDTALVPLIIASVLLKRFF